MNNSIRRGTESWLRYKDHTSLEIDGYSFSGQFGTLSKKWLSIERVYKADQWVLLSHYHWELILSLCVYLMIGEDKFSTVTDEQTEVSSATVVRAITVTELLSNPIFSLFKDVKASDEIFFSTILGLLGCLPPTAHTTQSGQSFPLAVRRRLTFCEWETQEVRPKTFTSIDELLLSMHTNREGDLWPIFARKIALSPAFLGYTDRLVLSEYETEMREVLWKLFCVYFPDEAQGQPVDGTESAYLWLWRRWEEESKSVVRLSPKSVSTWYREVESVNSGKREWDYRNSEGDEGEGDRETERVSDEEGSTTREFKRSRTYEDNSNPIYGPGY